MKKNQFLFVVLFLFSFYLQAQDLKFITHELKPFTWIDENNNFKGIVYELCNETIKRLGYNLDNIELMPFPRALKTVMEEDNYILFHVSKTVDREEKLK